MADVYADVSGVNPTCASSAHMSPFPPFLIPEALTRAVKGSIDGDKWLERGEFDVHERGERSVVNR